MDIAIEVAGLTVRRGKRTVLHDFAAAMERGPDHRTARTVRRG